jgi:hypothetical protein
MAMVVAVGADEQKRISRKSVTAFEQLMLRCNTAQSLGSREADPDHNLYSNVATDMPNRPSCACRIIDPSI